MGEVEKGAAMGDDYTLLTPENVDLRFDVAGLGSRCAAGIIDYLIVVVAITVLTLGGIYSSVLLPAQLMHDLQFAVLAVTTLLTFFAWWGYFILTEMLWNGQSPGKRRLGIRVVRASGHPINVTASLVRNLFRIVDLFLFIGIIVMVVDRRCRRLGDMAAGTLVIREPDFGLSSDLSTAFRPVDIPLVSADRIDAFPHPQRLTMAHYTLLRDYFARRGALKSDQAERLATDLANRLAVILGEDKSVVDDPTTFLATAARVFESRRTYGS
jgi:uncharacterized RDD family membrane protein YckC